VAYGLEHPDTGPRFREHLLEILPRLRAAGD
jgi:hypothetical protein